MEHPRAKRRRESARMLLLAVAGLAQMAVAQQAQASRGMRWKYTTDAEQRAAQPVHPMGRKQHAGRLVLEQLSHVDALLLRASIWAVQRIASDN